MCHGPGVANGSAIPTSFGSMPWFLAWLVSLSRRSSVSCGAPSAARLETAYPRQARARRSRAGRGPGWPGSAGCPGGRSPGQRTHRRVSGCSARGAAGPAVARRPGRSSCRRSARGSPGAGGRPSHTRSRRRPTALRRRKRCWRCGGPYPLGLPRGTARNLSGRSTRTRQVLWKKSIGPSGELLLYSWP